MTVEYNRQGKERCPLLLPFVRNGVCQLPQLHRFRLPSVDDRLDNVRRQQREPQQPVDEAPGNAFGFCDLCRRPIPPPSSNLFHRCARASARISVSSGRGFAGAQASPPSGAMITLRPPRRFQVIGMRTVMVVPSNSQLSPAILRFVFMPLRPHVTGAPRPASAARRPAAARSYLRAQGRPARPAAGRSAPARPGKARPRAARSR